MAPEFIEECVTQLATVGEPDVVFIGESHMHVPQELSRIEFRLRMLLMLQLTELVDNALQLLTDKMHDRMQCIPGLHPRIHYQLRS